MKKSDLIHKPSTQEIPFHSGLGVDIPSSSIFVLLSHSYIPPSPSHMGTQPWESHLFDTINGLTLKVDQMSQGFHFFSQDITEVKKLLFDIEERQRKLEYAHEFVWTEEQREEYEEYAKQCHQKDEIQAKVCHYQSHYLGVYQNKRGCSQQLGLYFYQKIWVLEQNFFMLYQYIGCYFTFTFKGFGLCYMDIMVELLSYL